MIIEAQSEGEQYRQHNLRDIDALLKDFDPDTIRQTGLLRFNGVEGFDVYNISAPFHVDGRRYIAGRVEPRNDEFTYKTVFFLEQEGVWRPSREAPEFELQDPFVCAIGDELVFGGVKAWRTRDGSAAWRTELWRGSNLNDLAYWTAGPTGMKGIRLVDCGDFIGVFTRPQGEVGGLGTIGFTRIDALDRLDEAVINNAELLNGLFARGEWGGVNQAKRLDDDSIGVLGHVARFEPDNSRSYYAMKFLFDPINLIVDDYQLVASRTVFPPAEPKRRDLVNVFYPGGWESTDTADVIYGGGGDSCALHGYSSRLFPPKGQLQ